MSVNMGNHCIGCKFLFFSILVTRPHTRFCFLSSVEGHKSHPLVRDMTAVRFHFFSFLTPSLSMPLHDLSIL